MISGGKTDTPDSESGVGVWSPAILMNIRVTVVTVYMQMYNMICGLSACSGEFEFPPTLGEECGGGGCLHC